MFGSVKELIKELKDQEFAQQKHVFDENILKENNLIILLNACFKYFNDEEFIKSENYNLLISQVKKNLPQDDNSKKIFFEKVSGLNKRETRLFINHIVNLLDNFSKYYSYSSIKEIHDDDLIKVLNDVSFFDNNIQNIEQLIFYKNSGINNLINNLDILYKNQNIKKYLFEFVKTNSELDKYIHNSFFNSLTNIVKIPLSVIIGLPILIKNSIGNSFNEIKESIVNENNNKNEIDRILFFKEECLLDFFKNYISNLAKEDKKELKNILSLYRNNINFKNVKEEKIPEKSIDEIFYHDNEIIKLITQLKNNVNKYPELKNNPEYFDFIKYIYNFEKLNLNQEVFNETRKEIISYLEVSKSKILDEVLKIEEKQKSTLKILHKM